MARVVVFLLCSCSSEAQVQPAPSPGGGFRIGGRVVNAKTGSVLAQARVTITDTENPQRTLSMTTNEDGRFEFNGVTAGKFALQGAKRGFIRGAYDQHEQFSTAIVTGAGLDTENLVLRLEPVAMLIGKVLDESGEPVRHASVTVYRENHSSGLSRIQRSRFAQTDDQGFYEAGPLDPGTYFVSIRARPWYEVHPLKSQREGSGGEPVLVDSGLDVAYPITYYGDVTDSDEATPIPVRGGDRLQVDIHLNPVPALHLLMRAPNDQTQGVNFPRLQAKSFDSSQHVDPGEIQIVSQGLYEVTGIPAGRYNMRVAQDGQFGGPIPIDLTSDGQELAPPTSDAPSTLKASVQIAGETKLPPELFIVLRDGKGKPVTMAQVDAQGQANFGPLVSGQYQFMVGSPERDYSVVRISMPGTEISGHTLNVTAGAPTLVSLTLVAGTATVQGFAKRSGKPASGVMIVLVPNDPENHRDLFRRDQSDLDGSFNLRSVIPGSYSVVAIENGWELDWSQPEVIARYAVPGHKLTVNERNQGIVHLPAPVEAQPR